MAARKKTKKTSTRKTTSPKSAAKKSAARKSATSSSAGRGAAATKAPKPGSKEEHYADLRRVALQNALTRLS
jgi:hypothetical protein